MICLFWGTKVTKRNILTKSSLLPSSYFLALNLGNAPTTRLSTHHKT